MPGWPANPLDLHIVSIGQGYYDFSQGLEGSPGTENHVLSRAEKILSGVLLDEISDDLVIAAASLVVNNRRFLILADDPYARLLFVLQCLSENAWVESDRFVAFRDEIALPIPQRLRIERRRAELFPKLIGRVLSSPCRVDWDGNIIHALEPSVEGHEWTISPGRVDVLLFLEPNDGGRTSTARLSTNETFERLLRGSISWQGQKASLLSKLHGLSRGGQSWTMRLGAPDRTFWHVERISTR
jgi:hypothetical protein